MNSKNNNLLNISQAREAMDKFKMQAANEVGVNLKNGYNGDLTSRKADDLGNDGWSIPYEVRDMIGRVGLQWGIVRGLST